MVLLRLRRARREASPPPPESRFEEYRPAYEEVLTAARDLAGEEALDDVAEWATEWTKQERHLPEPATLRAAVRELLEERGVDVPPDSPLREEA